MTVNAQSTMLFAGGPLDGQSIALADEPSYIDVPVDGGQMQVQSYLRQMFARGDSSAETVYVCADGQPTGAELDAHVRWLMRRRAETPGNNDTHRGWEHTQPSELTTYRSAKKPPAGVSLAVWACRRP